MNEREIRILKNLRNEIDKAAKKIEKYNPDNIDVINEYNIDEYEGISELARELIIQYDISLYYSPYVDLSKIDYLTEVLESKNEEAFIYFLEGYLREIKGWAEREEDLYFDNMQQWRLKNL